MPEWEMIIGLPLSAKMTVFILVLTVMSIPIGLFNGTAADRFLGGLRGVILVQLSWLFFENIIPYALDSSLPPIIIIWPIFLAGVSFLASIASTVYALAAIFAPKKTENFQLPNLRRRR